MLPVYNAEPYLREAVDSVLAQTYRNFELLALNDGSTDGSLAILRGYEARDKRVRVISRNNLGLVASLNELIFSARGSYLARMDADDVCMPHRFEQQVLFLNSSPCVAVGGWAIHVNEAGLPIATVKTPSLHSEIDQAHLKGHTSIWHPTALIRKDAVVRIGGYREEFLHAEDLDLWLRTRRDWRASQSLRNNSQVPIARRLRKRKKYIFSDGFS